MRHHNKKNETIITLDDAESKYFDNMECLPDHFYEDSDSVRIHREDIIYLFQDLDHDVTQHFIDKWSKEQNEDISEFCIGRRFNTNTPQDI
tara:strand:+ start:332 stop:604 length:273 start_codon:yes stop_codon:yes gene_type:complete